MLAGLLWIPFTLLAAAGQTARNAMQRELTAALGTVGATHVRFLFGFPFAIVFLAAVLAVSGLALPAPPPKFWPWVLLGAGAQIVATALMLATMNDRSFVVTIAYIKTEAIQAALFGLIFLHDPLTVGMVIAILVATAGVVAMSLKGKGAMEGGYRPVALGLFSGAMFAISAVGYRGAILSLGPAELRAGRDLHPGRRADIAGRPADALSRAARSRGARRDRARLAAVAVRGLHGRDRVAVLVSCLCAHQRRQRADAGVWSRCCSRRRSRISSSSRRRRSARQSECH